MLSELQQQLSDFLNKMFEVPTSKPQPQSDEDHLTEVSVDSSANLSTVSSSGSVSNVGNAAIAGGLSVLTPL